MSAPKKNTPVSQEESSKIQVEPLRENELGQVEGGFSEIANDSIEDGSGEINGISCKVTNQSQCG